MLVFGWRTAILTLVSVQVSLVATVLVNTTRNRAANRILAALLAVVVGLLTPFTIGFAGFYDAFPWLSFAPFAVSLAVGPLAYGYTYALVMGRPPPRFVWSLAPAAIQFAYQSACFMLPQALKVLWDDRGHRPFVQPVVSAATLIGLALYAAASLRLLRRYRVGLRHVASDTHRYAAPWLSRVLGALIVVLVVWGGYQAWEVAFGLLSYFDIFGLYLVLSAMALYLAIEGWRHAELAFPRLDDAAPAPIVSIPLKDWRAIGVRWSARTQAEGWWREPELNLPTLAARLATNTHHLSRALNEGLGVSFSAFVNGLRARAVAQALDAGRDDDLLTLALEAGFNSKAGFNRAFKAELGVTPSEYRRRHGSHPKSSSEATIVRRAPG